PHCRSPTPSPEPEPDAGARARRRRRNPSDAAGHVVLKTCVRRIRPAWNAAFDVGVGSLAEALGIPSADEVLRPNGRQPADHLDRRRARSVDETKRSQALARDAVPVPQAGAEALHAIATFACRTATAIGVVP